jgi:phosphodiesterase/alkaline phosphatase D-like protein
MEIIRKTAPPPGVFSRRGFLTGVGGTLVATALAPLALSRHAAAQKIGDDPFTLGVASGDPTPDGIVLWTRLAPKPLEGGGMPHHPMRARNRLCNHMRAESPIPTVHRRGKSRSQHTSSVRLRRRCR